MENQASDQIESLFEKIGGYVETRGSLFKLKAVDKSSDLFSSLISKLLVYSIIMVFFILLNIGLALLLGEVLGKSYYGFLLLALFYLIVGLVFIYMRKKWFKEPIANKIIQKFFK